MSLELFFPVLLASSWVIRHAFVLMPAAEAAAVCPRMIVRLLFVPLVPDLRQSASKNDKNHDQMLVHIQMLNTINYLSRWWR